MATTAQRRKRYLRRRAHALRLDRRIGQRSVGDILGAQARALLKQPRATCPVCGNKEKIRADGTMGKHTSRVDDRRVDCPGIGQVPA